MNYHQRYSNLDLAQAILTNRYMVTALLVNVNNLCYYLEAREKTLRALLPEEARKKLRQDVQYQDQVKFDTFKLSARYFNALVSKFGAEIVSEACVLTDTWMKKNLDKAPKQATINKQVKTYCIKLTTAEHVSEELSKAILAAKSIDYTLIDNETLAKQYIAGVPFYMRTLDKGCQYLTERFNL